MNRQIRYRDRAAILADIASVKETVAGTLTETRRELADGSVSTYYHIQRKVDGRNITRYVPREKAQSVKEGVAEHRRLCGLLAELAASDAAAILCGDAANALKKKRRK